MINPVLSIILVHYKTEKLTIDCIKSINEFVNDILYEIILVDNNSNDGSIEIIRKLYPDVSIIVNKRNVGFGSANNIGVKVARGEFVFFLNTDTLLTENSPKKLVEFFSHNEEKFSIGSLGCTLIDQDNHIIHSAGTFEYLPKIFLRDLYLHYLLLGITKLSKFIRKYIPKKDVLERVNNFLFVDYITGADLLMRKDQFLKINGFDENFFMYGEETDLQKRLSMQGKRSVLFLDTKIIHLVGGSRKSSNKSRIFKNVSYQYYTKKHLPKWYKVSRLLIIGNVISSLLLSIFGLSSYSFKENKELLFSTINLDYGIK